MGTKFIIESFTARLQALHIHLSCRHGHYGSCHILVTADTSTISCATIISVRCQLLRKTSIAEYFVSEIQIWLNFCEKYVKHSNSCSQSPFD